MAGAFADLRDGLGRRPRLLVVPVLVFELLAFGGAIAYLVRLSFYESAATAAYRSGTWTLANYAELVTNGLLQERLLFSLRVGAIVTACSLLLGFVYAYAAWRASGRKRTLLLGAVLVELLISIVIKVYAWKPLLAPDGTVNDLLGGVGPVELLNNEVGVVIGLVYSMLPYVVLPVYATLATLDETLLEAARELGASRARSVLEIVVPQAMPGLLAGGVTAFAWSTVAYAAPSILGSTAERTIANEAGRFINGTYDWPRAAALSVEAILVVLLATALAVGLVRRFGPRGATEGLL